MHRVRISGYPPTSVDPQIATVHPAQFTQLIHKRCELRLGFRITHQHADPPHPLGLLRARRERPRRCAAEKGDELAAFHLITKALLMPVSIARPPWLGAPARKPINPPS